MKSKLVFFILLVFSSSAFALQCESFFSIKSSKKIDLPLLNAVKRIRNYGTFKNLVMVNTKTNRMTLIVFDIFNDGKIGERKSIDDHVLELRGFASEMRYVYDTNTKDQILVSRLVKNPNTHREENLSNVRLNNLSLVDNLKKSETLEDSYQLQIFQATNLWLSRPGAKANVLVLPEESIYPFIEHASKQGNYTFKTLGDIIISLDPEGSI